MEMKNFMQNPWTSPDSIQTYWSKNPLSGWNNGCGNLTQLPEILSEYEYQANGLNGNIVPSGLESLPP